MIIKFLRIVITIAWCSCFFFAAENARLNPQTGDMVNALILGIAVCLSLPMSALWTPVLAETLCGPFIGDITTDSTYVEPDNRLKRWIDRAKRKKQRRLVLLLCLLKGTLRPELPEAFIVGLEHAKPGSRLEKFFAREVYRFNNAQNCLKAVEILKRHGITPGDHVNTEINLVLLGLKKTAPPSGSASAKPVPVPHMPQPDVLKRNPHIQLFKKASQVAAAKKTERLKVGKGGTQRLPTLDDVVKNA
jgi:hypothetical protein